MEDINSNEPLKKANKVLQEISDDEYEQDLAFRRQLYEMDKKAIKAAGYEKGVEEGMQKGEKEKSIEIAKNMLKKGISIQMI